MSVMVQSGFAGVSIQTSLVSARPHRGAQRRRDRRSRRIRPRKPQRVASVSSQLRSAQYITFGGDDVVAGVERLEHRGRGRHAGGEQQRAGRASSSMAMTLSACAHRGVVGPAVDEARRIGVVLVADDRWSRRWIGGTTALVTGSIAPHRLGGEAALRPGSEASRKLRLRAQARQGAAARQSTPVVPGAVGDPGPMLRRVRVRSRLFAALRPG